MDNPHTRYLYVWAVVMILLFTILIVWSLANVEQVGY